MTDHDDCPRPQDPGTSGDTDKAPAAINEWGIPDWRDAKAYGNVAEWSFDRWRWEFFRRRADLRAYFDKWADQTYRDNLELHEHTVGIDDRRPDEPGFCAHGSEEATRKFGYLGIPNPRIGEQPAGAIRPLAGWSHLTRLIDGSRRDDDMTRGRRVGGKLELAGVSLTKKQEWFLGFSLFDAFPVRLEPHDVAVKFDMNEPLEPQIAEARDLLRAHQTKIHGKLLEGRRHPDKWLGYLRTLDAREAGVSWSKIATLHPETNQTPQAASRIWKQAQALCFNF